MVLNDPLTRAALTNGCDRYKGRGAPGEGRVGEVNSAEGEGRGSKKPV